VPVGFRDPAVGHDYCHLVQGLGDHGPEIPVVLRRAHVGAGIPLDGVVQVGEEHGVADEEHGGVVPHQVPVTLVGVEPDGEPAEVPLGIGGAPLPGHGGEADEHVRLLSYLGEEVRLGIAGDVVGYGEGPEGTGTLGVHPPLGDDLAVEVGQFLQEPGVLEEDGAVAAGGHGVLHVGYGRTVVVGGVHGSGIVVVTDNGGWNDNRGLYHYTSVCARQHDIITPCA